MAHEHAVSPGAATLNRSDREETFGGLGARLLELREEAGLGLLDVARRSGVGLQTLIALEVGAERRAAPAVLRAIARALGVPPERLAPAADR